MLADRNELGWRAIPERESKTLQVGSTAEFVPEHVHHNYRYSDAYTKSKAQRSVTSASIGEYGKTFSNESRW